MCKHFEECGGCKLRDIPYPDQVQRKQTQVIELVSQYQIDTQIRPVNVYDSLFYRGKMEFTFAQEEAIICGLYSKKVKRKVVDIEECLLFSPDAEKVLEAVKRFVRGRKYSAYNKFSHKGFLRNLILRKTKFTKQLMAGIVTTSHEQLDKDAFAGELLSLELDNQVKSVYWVINDSLSDAVIFEKKELIYGEPFITEQLGDLIFNIDIDSFFQVNSQGAGDFYNKIKRYAQLQGDERVIDLFCGVGSIGLFLASGAKFVWGIELQKEIIDAAWQNAKANNVNNVSFFVSDARKFLNTHGVFYKDIDLLIINPPRCGLSAKVIRGILRLVPKKIIYSSCNPDSFFRDIKELLGNYSLDFVEPFDFFPHTPHLECLGLLKKIQQ